MNNSISMHEYQHGAIAQAKHDTKLGNKIVPKGYVNATAMCRVNKKKLNDWTRLKRSKAYLKALSLSLGIPVSSNLCTEQDTGIPVSQLIIFVENDGNPAVQGTWVHPDVAISIATWISPEFEVWANRTLRLVVGGEFAAKTADAAIAQQQLKETYDRVLDFATVWEKLYEPDFCRQVYGWFGPQFYWMFCYSFLTPVERCKIEQLNPAINGERLYRIHQFLEPETRKRLEPYIWQLIPIVSLAKGDKDKFLAGYREHFQGTTQLELF
jgi:KilA-N domain